MPEPKSPSAPDVPHEYPQAISFFCISFTADPLLPLERFDEEYEENFEFKSLVDSSDESVWERTDSTEVASLNNVSRVAIVGITNSDISSFESSIERIETKEKVDKGEI